MSRSLLIGVVFAALFALASSAAHAQYSRHMAGGHRGGFGGTGVGVGWHGAASQLPGIGRPNNLSLVVAQTQEGHEGVTNLLDQLRRLQDQQVVNQVNFHRLNDSFYERNGVNFGFNIRGGGGVVGLTPTGQRTASGDIEFRQGGANSALPPFGGFDPSSQGTVGFATRGKDADLLFNFFGGQGSNRSMTTTSPVVTIMNGTQGTISDTSQVPFVTGVIPVVGGFGAAGVPSIYAPAIAPPRSVVQDRIERLRYGELQRMTQRPTATRVEATRSATPDAAGGAGGFAGGPSSADRGDLSVAEIRARQATETTSDDAELASWLERARGAEAAGKPSVAKIYYRMAAKRATGQQQAEINRKLRELGQ